MSFGLVVAALSSLSLAFMIMFDRVMVTDCYQNRPKQAWLVSSIGGMTLGLLATALVWLFAATTTAHSIQFLSQTAIELFFPYGVLMFAAGALAMQVLYHYFHAFIPEDGREVNETAIAMWLASSPIWIFATLIIMQKFFVPTPILGGVAQAEVSWWFGLVMLLAVVSLIGFELAGQTGKYSFKKMYTSEYFRAIFWIQVFTVAYTIVLTGSLRIFEYNSPTVLALLPFYFLGFGVGIRVLLRANERKQLKDNWSRLKLFIIPIVIAEVVGAAVFFFEFFALADLDPTLVNLLIGAHVIPVFFMVFGLRYLRKRMEERQMKELWWWGIRFSLENLPRYRLPRTAEIIWLVLAMGFVFMGIGYVSA